MMRPLKPIVFSDFVLSRLLLANEDGLTKSSLKDAVKAIATSKLSASALTERLERALARLEEEGYAEPVSKARYRATEEGQQHILEQFKIDKRPPQLQWTTLKNTYWLAYALGLPPLTSETKKRLASADGLRAAILHTEFDLPTDVFSTLTKTRNALLWKQLLDPTVIQSLQAQLPQLNQKSFNQGTIMSLFLNDLLQSPKPLKWKSALDQLVAKVVKAKRKDSNQLRLAILSQALADSLAKLGPKHEVIGQLPVKETSSANLVTTSENELMLKQFADTVLSAAKNTAEGRFGENKVFISQVWKTLNSQAPDWALTLNAFKQKLLEASRKNLISLSRADLGYSLDSEDVADSEISHLQSQFHFIRTD